MNRKKFRRGVTLIEMIIAVAILGVAALFARIGVDILNVLFQSSARVNVQRDTQLVLYSMNKEIRNCKQIIGFTHDTLQLEVFDTRTGFNTQQNPGLFNPVNLGTTTYQYVNNGSESYLRKQTEFGGMVVDDTKLLRNMLLQPDATSYIFNACDSFESPPCLPPWDLNAAKPPYESVEVWLRVSPSFIKGVNTNYVAQAMKRTRTGL